LWRRLHIQKVEFILLYIKIWLSKVNQYYSAIHAGYSFYQTQGLSEKETYPIQFDLTSIFVKLKVEKIMSFEEITEYLNEETLLFGKFIYSCQHRKDLRTMKNPLEELLKWRLKQPEKQKSVNVQRDVYVTCIPNIAEYLARSGMNELAESPSSIAKVKQKRRNQNA